MRVLRAWVGAFLCLGWVMVAAAAGIQPYQPGDWKRLVRVHAGAPLVVHFWGITCGPCIEELPRWGSFVRQHPEAAVVFLEVDQAPERVARRWMADAHIDRADNRMLVAPFDEYMRFEIDPRWEGELPTTLLVGADGKTQRWSGEVDFRQLEAWLARERRIRRDGR